MPITNLRTPPKRRYVADSPETGIRQAPAASGTSFVSTHPILHHKSKESPQDLAGILLIY